MQNSPGALFLTIVQSILPILVTLALGFFAAKRGQFDTKQAGVLTRFVMLYALPLELFASILTTPRERVLSAGPLAAVIAAGMIGGYLVVFAIARALGRDRRDAAMIAMTTSGPSVPFIGIPVLGQLFGPISAVPVSVGALAMNLFQVPLTLILLTSTAEGEAPLSFRATFAKSCREPVVWAPMLAVLLNLGGATMPGFLHSSFLLLGKATGGAALFASGIILCARKVRLSPLVGIILATRNMLIPGLAFLAAKASGMPHTALRESVLTLAIPSAAIDVMLALRFKVLEREIASVLFFGTMTAILTMSFFIWLTA